MTDSIYIIELSDKASFEAADTYKWYEERQEGLGEQFAKVVEDKLKKVAHNPYHYKCTRKTQYEALVERFPYVIVYHVNEKRKSILIISIFHTSRHPKAKHRKL